MRTLLIFLLLTGNVFAYTDGGSYPDAPTKSLRQRAVVKPEPMVKVDRHVLNMDDAKNDPAVLYAGAKPVAVLPEIQVVEKVVYKDRLVIDKPDPEPITKIIWESD